jgi:osmotically-inducible protein OsmY
MRKIILWTIVSMIIVLALSRPSRAGFRPVKNDLWIQTALDSVMEKDGRFDLDRIDTSTHNGVVTLSGTVFTGDEKGLAELLAMQIPGVKAVKNEIRVVPAMTRDIELEKKTRSTLIENPLLNIRELEVRASGGVVTLRGIVYRAGEKPLARSLVHQLPGVRRVVDRIEYLQRA